ncbi:MAG: DUF1778 domain-containing protein [Bryobacteraceae bacterium]
MDVPARANTGVCNADRRTFVLNAANWEAFAAALDAPPKNLPRLERPLREPGFFDAEREQREMSR